MFKVNLNDNVEWNTTVLLHIWIRLLNSIVSMKIQRASM